MAFEVYLRYMFKNERLKSRFDELLNYCERNRRELYEEFCQCPWFVDHGFEHVKGVLSNLDGLLLPQFQMNPNFLNDRELFYLLCAALYHDIGMCYIWERGGDEYSDWSIKVRKIHGLLSAEMIKEKNVIPQITDDEKRIIAEICKYHQSKAPLTESQAKEFGNEALVEEPISELSLGEEFEEVRLRFLAAILRLADACDINYRRAKKEIFNKKIENNKEVIRRELKEDFIAIAKLLQKVEDIQSLIQSLKKENDPNNIKELCDKIMDKIKQQHNFQEIYDPLERILNKIKTRIEILNIQQEHYSKHQSIANVYFILNDHKYYIVLEPYETKPNTKERIEGIKGEIKKELKLVREVLKDNNFILPKDILSLEECKRLKLDLDKDVRIRYKKEKEKKEKEEEFRKTIHIMAIDKTITPDEYRELLVTARRKGIPEEHARAMIINVAIQVNAEVYDENGNKLRGRER